jgi:lipopolysaccharide transport system ATP-binding protein
LSSVIQVENLSKQYRLGTVGTGSFSHDFNRAWHRIRGKEDPYLKIGEVNDRTQRGKSDYVWALKDINFEVKQGEVMGIIGRNGAGKSTLLKILSRTTSPTSGSVKIKGRVASLLEVGTGFHPELSGRDNIFLNGAILGMTKREIKSKLDEIIDFAGVERYIDTPVKRYSSGMYVRLAFGVAAHLEPEILIVDEVLAVGDAEFQKKALGKMKDVSTKEGRTVLFVSHNLTAIQTLCSFAILMENGKVDKIGESKSVIDSYLSNSFINSIDRSWNSDVAPGNTHVKLISAKIIPQLNSVTEIITVNTALLFQFEFILYANEMEISIAIEIYTLEGVHIFTSGPTRAIKIKQGKYVTSCLIPAPFLNSGTYTTAIQIVKDNIEMIHRESDLLMFEINDTVRSSGYTGKWPGLLRPSLEWKMDSVNI